MTETRQTLFFGMSLLTLIAAAGALVLGFMILDQYRTDNQTIATLRAQLASTQQDLKDTEQSMAKEVEMNLALKDEMHRREMDAMLKTERGRM